MATKKPVRKRKPTRRKQMNLKKDFEAIAGQLSRAEGAFAMIAEDNRDPLSVAQEMQGCIRNAQRIVSPHLAGGIEGDTDVTGDMTGGVGGT